MLPSSGIYGFGSDGAQYFAVTENNGIFGYRIDSDGNPIDDSPKKLLDKPYLGYVLVAGNTAPAANLRTFTAVARTDTGFALLRMRSATGAVLAPILVDTNNKYAYPNLLAGDGTNLVLGWAQQTVGPDTEFWTARFEPTAGTLSNKKVSPFERLGSISFDGTSYVEMWQAAEYKANMRRLDTSFSLVDASGGLPLPTYSDAHGSNHYGRTLLVSSEYVPQDLGSRLVGYLIDNDLAPGDPDDAPVTCLPDSQGGAGGEGGAGGAGGDDGGGGTLNGGTSNGGSQTGGGTVGTSGGAGGDAAEAGAANGGVATGGEPNGAGAPATGDAGEPSVNGGTPGGGAAGSSAGTTTEGGVPSTSGSATNVAGTTSAGASNETSGTKDASGCGCRATPETPTQPWALALSVVAVLLRRRKNEGERIAAPARCDGERPARRPGAATL